MNTLALVGDQRSRLVFIVRVLAREIVAKSFCHVLWCCRADRQRMQLLRSAFFALLLVLAQSAALLHFVDHLKHDADEGGEHACVVCLAAHALDAPVPTPAKAVAGPVVPAAPLARQAWFSCSSRIRRPCARAPPTA